MSREQADQVAMATDSRFVGMTISGLKWPPKIGRPGIPFQPHRLYGLAARLLARSNAVYDKVDYRDSGSFAEVGTTRHAVKP